MRRVVVKIENLVLKGFRYEDRHAIAQGLQDQLAQLLSEPGMAKGISAIGTLPRLRAGQIDAVTDATPQQVGIAAANAIGKGLTR